MYIVKIIDRSLISGIVETYKAAGKTIVFTNGCFDILHAGHVRYLMAARELGDCLIVGLNSDTSVQTLKGPSRPINHQEDRAEVLAGLQAVDCIVIFEEKTAVNLIATIKPEIYVKGGDYNIADIPEAEIVKQYGGRVQILPEVPGRSSTNVLRKLDQECSR